MINKKRIFIIFAMLAMLLSGIVSLGDSHIAPNAAACEAIGSYMGREKVKTSDVIFPSAKNRKWTVEELFSHGPRFSTYYGEGEGTWLYADKVDRGLPRVDKADWNDNNVQNNLKAARTLGSCTTGGGSFIPNAMLSLSSGIVWLTNKAINFSIGDNGMVESIGKIVGGDGSANNGLIATFRSSLYMPLVVIAFVLTGFTIAKKGLIDRKLREALSSAVWSVLAFVVGLTLMFSPSLLANIPQAATNTISTCILGALGGQNCLNNQVTTPSMLTGTECRSEIVGGKNGIETAVNSMNCSIWKAFVLEPWAEEQFGAPYSELYTHNIPQGGKKWTNTPEGKEKLYCVNLASTKSASASGQTLVMDLNSKSTVCNVALYQMYLRTYMEDPINHNKDKVKIVTKEGSAPYDIRWFDIIVPMAKNSSNWANWSGTGRVMHRFGTSLMGVIAVILSSAVLLMLSIFGSTYKIIGAILMAFSPIFFLFAIEPNRGRKIFLGWLESLFSSILKYFAITMLMVVALTLYSGVLSNTSGLTSFVSVIVLTVALWMYRKEVVDLIGASNMGGQRLSNKTNDMMEKFGKEAKEKGQAYVGGRIGGAWGAKEAYNKAIGKRRENLAYLQKQLSAATTEEERSSINSQIKTAKEAIESLGTEHAALKEGAKQGGLQSLQRSMKRGTSITSAAFSQADRTKREMARADEKNYKGIPPIEPEFGNTNDFGGPNGPDRPNGPDGPNGSDDDFRAQGIKAQRQEINYDDSLSEKEVAELKEFEDKLAKILNDDELLEMANDEELMQDGNKRALMQNELNARIRHNSLNGIPSGDLSRHELANPKNISNEELLLNLEVSRENFLENGDTSEYNKYQELLAERSGRGLITPNNARMEAMAILDRRKEIENSGKEYVRDENVPTSEEVQKDPTKYLENEEVKASPRLLSEEEQRLANEPEESKKTPDNQPQAERTIELEKRPNSEVDKGEPSKPKNADEVAHQSESAESIKDGMASEKEVKVNRTDTALPDLDDKQNPSNKMDSPELPSLDNSEQGPKMPSLDGLTNPIPPVIPVPGSEASDRDNNQSHQDSEPRTPGTPLPELNEEIVLTPRRINQMNDLDNSVPLGKPEKQEFAEESSKPMGPKESRHTDSRVKNNSGKPEQAKSPQENKRAETTERNTNHNEQQSVDLGGKLPTLDGETKSDRESSREQEQAEAHYRERTPGPQQKVEPRPKDRDYSRVPDENLGQKTNNRDNSEWVNQGQNQSDVTRNKNDRDKESFRRDSESVESRNNVNPLPHIKNEEVKRPEDSSRQDTDRYVSRDNSQGTPPLPPIKNEERPKERDYSRIEPASSNQQRVEEPTRVKPTAKGKPKENRADSREQHHEQPKTQQYEQPKESSSKPVNSGQQENFASNDVQAPSLDRNDSRPLLKDEGSNESSKSARNTESTSTETKAKKSKGFSNLFKKEKEVEPTPKNEQLDLGLDFDAELDFLNSNADELETTSNQDFNAEDDKTLPPLD